MNAKWAVIALLIAAACTGAARAEPFAVPGEEGLRHDVHLLADAGILRTPVTSWPLSWPDIARDVFDVKNPGDFDDATQAALDRVRQQARRASSTGFKGLGLRASAAHEPERLRRFAGSPRDEGELQISAGWLGDHIAVGLRATVVLDPDDGQELRADGSYLAFDVGNWIVSAGVVDRWWGPGSEGSLILSNNARPVPSVTLERNYSDPFKSRWLSWIGPWRASIAVGQTESSGVAVPNAKLLAARVNFKPRPWLEFGLSRTAQFCGDGRPCDFDTFVDLLFGRDNRSDSLSEEDEPGNQMAGYDVRMRSPWPALPLAIYTQWIGEDEAGGFPSKFLGLAGAEVWGSSRFGGWRLRGEFADTACTFTREEPDFNCAYRNTLYPQGYTYRGRVIGHSMDNDGRMYSLGGTLVRPSGNLVSFVARRVELNRDGTGSHTISTASVDLYNVELRYSRVFGAGRLSLGAGYDDFPAASHSGARGFMTWQQGF